MKLDIARLLVLVHVATAGVIFANVALLGVARGGEPVGKLSPKLFLATAPRVSEPSAPAPSQPATAPTPPATNVTTAKDDTPARGNEAGAPDD